MTGEERLKFERLKARVAELETRPSGPQTLETAIKGSAMEKLARIERASIPTNISAACCSAVFTGTERIVGRLIASHSASGVATTQPNDGIHRTLRCRSGGVHPNRKSASPLVGINRWY